MIHRQIFQVYKTWKNFHFLIDEKTFEAKPSKG